MKHGVRIWEVQDNKIPKTIYDCQSYEEFFDEIFPNLDLENKTYAIRIGKDGLK
jgi:hypothetical protein